MYIHPYVFQIHSRLNFYIRASPFNSWGQRQPKDIGWKSWSSFCFIVKRYCLQEFCWPVWPCFPSWWCLKSSMSKELNTGCLTGILGNIPHVLEQGWGYCSVYGGNTCLWDARPVSWLSGNWRMVLPERASLYFLHRSLSLKKEIAKGAIQ